MTKIGGGKEMINHKKIAQELYKAEIDNQPIDTISEVYENLTLDDAYKIQLINIERRVAQGKKITGKKIGLTSQAMQVSLGVDTPDFGILYDSMEVTNGKIPEGRVLQPRMEGELAFVLKKDLGDANSIEDVLEATDYVLPALEIVASRIKDWKITLVDTVADNASCGMYLLSDQKIDPQKTDLKEVFMTMYKNGQEINSAYASAVMDHPANAVLWLVKSLAHYGVTLNKGDIILSGALTAAVPAESGDEFMCDFSEFGQLGLKFE